MKLKTKLLYLSDRLRDLKSNIKTIILSVTLIMALNSCAPYTGIYKLQLSDVQQPKTISESEINGNEFKNKDINISWIPNSIGFKFCLENKTDNSIKVIWDEAIYVDLNSTSRKIIHSGVNFIDRQKSQVPSKISKGGKLEISITPINNIKFDDYYGWTTLPLFRNNFADEEVMNACLKEDIGKSVQIILPIKIKEKIEEYIFYFKLESFKLKITKHRD